MRAFVVLSLVFSLPSQETGLGKRLRNDLFLCLVGRKTTTQSINQSITILVKLLMFADFFVFFKVF